MNDRDQNIIISERSRTIPRIELPTVPRASDEELARRRALIERARRLREEVGPIGIRTDELIRQVREEADGA